MKRTIVKTTFLLVSLFGLITLSSCEKDNPPSDGGNDPKNGQCNTYGTFTRLFCGSSIYDNYWIRTDDGRYLQPCETDIVTLCPLPISEGTRIKFGYKKISGRTACDDIIKCEGYDERMNGSSKVRITCIEFVNQEPDTIPCSITGTVTYDNSCRIKTLEDDNGNIIEPQNQINLSAYPVGTRVMYGYTPLLTLAITCTGAQAAVLDCIKPLSAK